MHFSPFNRNSSCCVEPGTRTEKPQGSPTLKAKSWLHPGITQRAAVEGSGRRKKYVHPLWLMLVTAVRSEWILQDPERTKCFLCTQVKEQTGLTAVKQPAAKRVDEIMETVRRATATREVLLSRKFPDQVLFRLSFRMSSVNTGVFCTGSAIRGPGVGRQDALLLLRDLRAKYKTLHQKMMGQVAGS